MPVCFSEKQYKMIEEFAKKNGMLNASQALEKIKKTKQISHLPLIKQSRLSVMPIDFKSWKIICKMGKV